MTVGDGFVHQGSAKLKARDPSHKWSEGEVK